MPTQKTGLHVLVVDDTRTDLAIITAMLEKMGHEVVQSHSGEAALEVFRRHMPDMVLMDVAMPGMGGYEAVRAMRRIAQDDWIPIVFVTAMGREDDIVRGIEAGGDDYLLKPLHYKMLHAKVSALHQHLRLFRRMEEQSRLLLNYQTRNEIERHSAQEFMGRLLALDRINDPLVHFHLKPAEVFSGDLIAAARSPAGHLYTLLADSSGHGLTAALAVMPVLQAFYSMVEKGYSVGALAAEMNHKIGEFLPSQRFVAAALVALDAENGRISVWNGGCPPAVLLGEGGAAVYRFNSMHLPLGILKPDEFDDEVVHYHYGSRRCQLLLCSDGAVDCFDASDMGAGMLRLLQAAGTDKVEKRLPAMMAGLEQQLAGKPAHDDMALILIDCPPEDAAEGMPPSRSQPRQIEIRAADTARRQQQYVEQRIEWQFDLILSAQQLKHADIVPLLLHVMNQVEYAGEQDLSGKLFLVLSELFNNALDHGLLKLDSALKNDSSGMDRYFEERSARLDHLEKGEIKIKLAKVTSMTGPCLKVAITDSGEGFDFLALQAAALDSGLRRHGRGIALVENLSGRLYYTDDGRKSHVCIPLQSVEQCDIPLSMGGCNPGRPAAPAARKGNKGKADN